jgi:hypothetical protein
MLNLLIRHRGQAVCRATYRVTQSNVSRAGEFNVPPTFLLQQAAWLYERHLDHVRAQMKKVGGQTAPALSSTDSTQAKASAATNRPGSGLVGGNAKTRSQDLSDVIVSF